MSQTITEAFIQQFNRNVYMLNQQIGSRIRGNLREETVHAKKAFFDRLAPTSVVEKVSRHDDTPLIEQIHSLRAVGMKDWGTADLVDREDKIRLLINPESECARNFAMAMGRQMDIRIIAAFTADAEEGQFGGTFVPFPAANTIPSGGTGLTVAKVREVKRRFDSNETPDDGRVFIISAQALEDLLSTVEVTSFDFNRVKALVQGQMPGDTWLGFKWIRVADALLPIDGSLDRSCYAYQRDGMGLAIGADMTTMMDRRPDKWNALQILLTASFDAVRVDDDRVLRVLVRETA